MATLGYFHCWEVPPGGNFKKLVYLIIATCSLAPSSASQQPTTKTSAIAHPQLTNTLAAANIAKLEARSGWWFSCFAQGEPCMVARVGVDGATKQSGSSVSGCSAISAKGCSSYSFDNEGDYKLCLYESDDCTGDGSGLVGSRICEEVGSSRPGSWKVVSAGSVDSEDHVCD
ncbi:hypothetical protein F5Y06DRAFT_297987 [Hypoxylon sp. FL0890]|nr:hypothetical protein F5Y06DRAFT_297987 [Hypoxylon sp. FL0890]